MRLLVCVVEDGETLGDIPGSFPVGEGREHNEG
jgi:hypothetical protein